MASLIYNKGKSKLLKGEIDFEDDTIKCALVTSSYTPDKDTDEYFDDLTNEVSGTGYTTGGKVLTNKSVNEDDVNDRAEFDADDITWTVATITARAAIIYKDTGVAGTSPLIVYIDFGEDYSTSGADFTVEWDSEGILALGE